MGRQILKMPCPVTGCGDRTAKNWYHATCGSIMYINDDAYL